MIYSKELDFETANAMEAEHLIKPTEYGFDYTKYVDAQGREYTCKNNPLDDLVEKIEINQMASS